MCMAMASTSGRDAGADNAAALSSVAARFQLHLHPSSAGDVMGAVREQLNLGLLRFNEELGGVVLAYSGERVTSSAARLHPYFPFLAVSVTATVTLFTPRPGQQLVGRVNKVGADYVGLLVLGVFNAAIGAGRMRREFKCRSEANQWVSIRDPTHRIAVGSYVRFTVDSVLDSGGMFSIVGSLQEPGTGEASHASVRAAAAAAGGSGGAGRKVGGGSGKQPNGVVAGAKQQQGGSGGGKEGQGGKEGKRKDKKKQKDKGGDKAAAAAATPAAKAAAAQPAAVTPAAGGEANGGGSGKRTKRKHSAGGGEGGGSGGGNGKERSSSKAKKQKHKER